MSTPVIAVIEWSSDSAQEPAVFLADDVVSARRAVAEFLLPMVGDLNDIDAEWVERFPLADLDDDAQVVWWLAEVREATTDGWLTLYFPSDRPGGETYADLRAARRAADADTLLSWWDNLDDEERLLTGIEIDRNDA